MGLGSAGCSDKGSALWAGKRLKETPAAGGSGVRQAAVEAGWGDGGLLLLLLFSGSESQS